MGTRPTQDDQEPFPGGPEKPSFFARFLKVCRAHRAKAILAGSALSLVLAAGLADALLAEPMRRWAERTMNAQLKGYTVRIGRVDLHLWRLAFTLEDLVLVQNSHPSPPVAEFGALGFSLYLDELLRFKVAGNLVIKRPALHINLPQLQEEAKRDVSLKERGWQGAVESVFPFKLERVTVQDGSLLYVSDDTASKPLKLAKVSLVASNIRNISAAKGTYPSPVRLDGALFDTGRIRFNGAADFLREPHTAAQGSIQVDRVPLDRLNPLAHTYQLKTEGGFLSADGSVEYTPESQTAHLKEVLLEHLRVDYVTSQATKAAEKAHARQAVRLARTVRNAPTMRLQMDTLKLVDSQLGFVNEGTNPTYRLFVSGLDLTLKNLGNQADAGRSEFQVRGALMGTGALLASGGAQITASPPDFDIRLQLDNAKLPDLNRALLAHAGVDVAEGLLSVYTDITVKDGRVDGYFKPLVKDLKIYDKQKDQGKHLGRRMKMHVMQMLATLFRNRSSRQVATVTHLSGSTDDLRFSTWEALRKFLANGLFEAIRPGFLDPPGVGQPPKPAVHPSSPPGKVPPPGSPEGGPSAPGSGLGAGLRSPD